MADTYGVTLDDVQGEVKSLFPTGFGVSSSPEAGVVTSWITAHDVYVTLQVERSAGVSAAASDKAAPLARRYVIVATVADVVRAAYAGRDPLQVKAAADPYDAQAKQLLDAIRDLGAQAASNGSTAGRVIGTDVSASRDLLVRDDDLGALGSGRLSRARRF